MWSWAFKYENGKQSTELVVPVGRPVAVNLESADVIHSFFVPAFRLKEDCVPGRKNHAWFQVEREGTYDILCPPELAPSGLGARKMAEMNSNITVVEFIDYRCGYCKRAHSDMAALLKEAVKDKTLPPEPVREQMDAIKERAKKKADALGEAVRAQPNIRFLCPQTLTRIERLPGGGCAAELNDERIRARLLVAADGPRSPLREHFGFTAQHWDPRQLALVAVLRTERAHGHCARQWFAPAGPLAFLPLHDEDGDTRCVAIVWSQEQAVAERLHALPDDALCRALEIASEHAPVSYTHLTLPTKRIV